MKFFLIAAFLAAASAANMPYQHQAYSTGHAKQNDITIVSQSDVRNPDGSSRWSYQLSDGTTREESEIQKLIGNEMGNTNSGSSSFITPEGQRIALTWVADENGFRPMGDHLPVAPEYTPEVAAVWATVRPPTYSASAYAAPAYAAPTVYRVPAVVPAPAYVVPTTYRTPTYVAPTTNPKPTYVAPTMYRTPAYAAPVAYRAPAVYPAPAPY